jgi:hypothetical protein
MIRRIITPRGVRYTENGRFIESRRGTREWVRQNIDTIRADRTRGLQYSDLTTRERQSFSAQNRWRYNGRYVSNPYNFLNQFEPVTRGNRNLDRFFSQRDFEAITRFGVDRVVTRDGDGDLQRTSGELFDIASSFRDLISQGYEFNLVTETGEDLTNLRAIDYLRRWESRTIENIRIRGREEGRELDRIRINYPHTIDANRRRVTLNLNDIDYDTDIEAYFDTP